jgi:hypothetical protein
MAVYKFWCNKEGHIFETKIPKNRYESFIRKCESLKKVCPKCKPENVRIFPLEDSDGCKIYRCPKNHVNTMCLFKDGMVHVSCNNVFTNFLETKGDNAEQLVVELVDDGTICCQYEGECGLPLVAIDDTQFVRPNVSFIKTRVRVGDIWDKAGVADPVAGSYDGDFYYKESEFEKRNKERLSRMRRERNISKDRLPGKPLNEPTNPDE